MDLAIDVMQSVQIIAPADFQTALITNNSPEPTPVKQLKLSCPGQAAEANSLKLHINLTFLQLKSPVFIQTS